jgi:hypothetical protein
MCHSDESRPPRPPVEGVAADRYDLTLTASDGASFMAYAAVPEEPSGRSVVILPDVRGLHAFYKELAALFAEAERDSARLQSTTSGVRPTPAIAVSRLTTCRTSTS